MQAVPASASFFPNIFIVILLKISPVNPYNTLIRQSFLTKRNVHAGQWPEGGESSGK